MSDVFSPENLAAMEFLAPKEGDIMQNLYNIYLQEQSNRDGNTDD